MEKFHLKIFFLFSFFISSTCFASSLEQALTLAYKNNPVIEGERSSLRSLDEEVSSASSKFLPSVSISTSYGESSLNYGEANEIKLEPKVSKIEARQILFAGGRYLDIFPLRGIISDNWNELNSIEKILDYMWHLALPIFSLVIGGFASLTMLTKNSFLDQINQQYVMTARAKGLSEKKVIYGHVFRNAMLIVIAGFPSAFIGILFSSSLFIEVIFSLDGLGLLGYEAALTRDYPVIFATLYFFSLLGLILSLIHI